MAHALSSLPGVVPGVARVREVAAGQVLVWLRRGWDDLRTLRRASLAYGLFFAAAGWLLLILAAQAAYLVPALMGGFLLVAPFAAIGLYALSAQREAGTPPDSEAALFAWRHNAGSIALFGLMLALFLILWERLAAIVFALSFGGTVPDLSRLAQDLLFSGNYLPLVLSFVGVGALLAASVFVLSVVTGQVLLDRPLDLIRLDQRALLPAQSGHDAALGRAAGGAGGDRLRDRDAGPDRDLPLARACQLARLPRSGRMSRVQKRPSSQRSASISANSAAR